MSQLEQAAEHAGDRRYGPWCFHCTAGYGERCNACRNHEHDLCDFDCEEL